MQPQAQAQAPPSMMNAMPSFPPANITTDQIQKYLDENKKLILAILDNQNLGKLAECAQYQAQLQKNLMYLAAIADAQPQVATVPSQMASHPATQQGAYYMQQHATAMSQQPGVPYIRMPPQAQYNSPLQIHEQPQHPLHQQHQQSIPGQMNFRPTGPSNGMHTLQPEIQLGGGSSGGPPAPAGGSDARVPNQPEGQEAGSTGDEQRNTASIGVGGHSGGEGQQSYLKSSEEGK